MELLKDTFYVLVMFILVWCGFYLYTRHDSVNQRANRYDCALTEFQARVPDDIREECRRRKLELLNKEKE